MKLNWHRNEFQLLPERALYWPDHHALICSDLHWGREAFMQKQGIAIPDTSFKNESKILEKLFAQTQAKEWWILGDWIHHPQGLHPALIDEISSWMSRQLRTGLKSIRFVPGNHDRGFEKWVNDFPVEVHQNGLERDSFLFLHEPPAGHPEPRKPTWYGHLHPSVYLPLLGNKKLPCFWVRSDEAYLPAFSRLAGGADIKQVQPTDRVFVVTSERVIEI